MKRASAIGVVVLSVGIVACNQTPEADLQDTREGTFQTDEPAGTVGVVDDTQTTAIDPAGEQQEQQQQELPNTASPLALAGLVGLASLTGALGVRMLRGRRSPGAD